MEDMTRTQEIEARLAQIPEELEKDGADLDALEKEVRDLKDEKLNIEKRAELRKEVADGAGETVKTFNTGEEKKVKYTAESVEYRNAYLKNLLGREMSEEERTAFVQTTTNTPDIMPTTMLNEIWDLVSGQHVIMGDIRVLRTGTIIEIVKHTAIAAGKAKKVDENAANDDEQNTFVKVTLSGNDFSKTVKISYKSMNMSLDALQTYIDTEIADSLGEAMAEDAVTNAIEANINAANKITTVTAATLTFKELAKAFGALKRASNPVVYVTRNTLFNYLVTLEDTEGHLIYQNPISAGANGALLGSVVKIEDAVGDGVVLIGDGQRVTYNMVQDIMIERDKDIEAHKNIFSGYACGEGSLIDDLSFSMITVKTA
jgi:HK97 family phage major capsid protein